MREIIKLYKREIKILLLIIVFVGVVIVGGGMNSFAEVRNGHRMPVLSNAEYSGETHFSFQEKDEINNYFFVDRFQCLTHHVCSIGDFTIVFSGVFLVILLIALFVVTKKIHKIEKIYNIK